MKGGENMVMVLPCSKTEDSVVAAAIRTIQEHLDKEALNRGLTDLQPRELCPMQKTEMVEALMAVLN